MQNPPFKHVSPSTEGAPGGLEISVGVDSIVPPILAVLFLLPYLLNSLEEFVIGPSGISGKLRAPEMLGQTHSTHPGKAVEAVEAHTLLKTVPGAPAAVAEALPEPDDFRAGYALKDLAQMYLNQGRRKDALQAMGQAKEIFENVLKQDPDNASAHNGLGNIYYLQGEYEKAVEYWENFLQLAQDNPQLPPDYVRGVQRRYRALRGR